MAGPSDIEWTDATWNPIVGCTMISPGCTNCYAMRMAARLQAIGATSYRGVTRKSGGRFVWTGTLRINEKAMEAPLAWKRPKKIFVNSMSDLFQDGVSIGDVARVWDVMARAPQHRFQVLTKRPDRMRAFLQSRKLAALENVWIGASVETGAYISRIDELRETPAAVRFISFEPLIGAVGPVDLSGIHWAIVGGESGPKARRIEEAWVDELLEECREQNVAFFFKQWGGTNKKAAGRRYRGRTWDEYPLATAPHDSLL
jgi:protein gp37